MINVLSIRAIVDQKLVIFTRIKTIFIVFKYKRKVLRNLEVRICYVVKTIVLH